MVVDEGEGFGNRHRLGHPGRLDQDRIETLFARKPLDLDQQVVAQCAADAAIRQFDELLFDMRERGGIAHEGCIDIDGGQIVDDHGDAQTGAIREDMVQERGLASAQKTGEHGDGQ